MNSRKRGVKCRRLEVEAEIHEIKVEGTKKWLNTFIFAGKRF
jgi:hypothetical protein